MDILQAQAYCDDLAFCEAGFPFGESVLVYKVGGRIFALFDLSDCRASIALKCDPDLSVVLRERYDDILPAYHMNKRHWIQVGLKVLPHALIEKLIRHSYFQVTRRLPSAFRSREELKDLCDEVFDGLQEANS